jgi:hypothetical protein
VVVRDSKGTCCGSGKEVSPGQYGAVEPLEGEILAACIAARVCQ